MKAIEAIIFDLGGTLINYSGNYTPSQGALAKRLSIRNQSDQQDFL